MRYRANSKKRLALTAIFMSFLFLTCFGAMAVYAEDEAADNEAAGEIRLTTEGATLEAPAASGKRPVQKDHQIMQGTIDLPADATEPAAPSDSLPLPEESHLLNSNTSIPAQATANSPETDTAKKRQRVTPPNYKGKSIASAKATSAPVVKEKKYSLNKQAQITKARSVHSEVAYADSPELQAYNEKRRKIKEHFKAQLENRPERKAKKINN